MAVATKKAGNADFNYPDIILSENVKRDANTRIIGGEDAVQINTTAPQTEEEQNIETPEAVDNILNQNAPLPSATVNAAKQVPAAPTLRPDLTPKVDIQPNTPHAPVPIGTSVE